MGAASRLASESVYRALLETVDVGVCLIEVLFDAAGQRAVDHRFLECNGAFLRHTGLADVVGRTVCELVPNVDPYWCETYGQVARTGEPASIERYDPAMDRWLSVEASRVNDSDRALVALLVRDITARRRADEALRESERRAREAAARAEAERGVLDAILEAAPAGIMVADAEGRLVRFNPANELLWGPAPFADSIETFRDWKGWWADESPRKGTPLEPREWALARALRGETVHDDVVEIEPVGSPGTRRVMLNSAAPVRDAQGRVRGAVGVQMDITALVAARVERSQADAALVALNARLREADRRKDDFIGVLAHELRNPLAPVRLAVEILRRTAPAEPRTERVRDVIDRQVTHMSRLIDDLLDVSRIARGKLALRTERCDVARIAQQTVEDYRPSLEAAGLTLVIAVPPEPIWVEGDPVRLAQMVGNLLHNAGRFTEQGGRVEVRVFVNAESRIAQIDVCDTGVGIEPELLARLFDPFSQAHQDLARSKGGLGLGLALTKGLAELHGGAVAVRSGGEGQGTTFTLQLPLIDVRDPAGATEPPAFPHGEGLRILIVEDNHDAAETLGDLLLLAGHDVKIAYDGTSAVAAASGFKPHVVISDIGLPGELDGYSVARALRADPAHAGVRLVAISGYANEEARRRSREAGFDAHLAKPPDIATLERALADVRRT